MFLFRNFIRRIPVHTFYAGIAGLTIALIAAAIISLPLSLLPGAWAKIAPLIALIVLIYIIVSAFVLRGRDVAVNLGATMSKRRDREAEKVILDTNSIIDGRIVDIIQTGFVRGSLLIPKFILDELHHIADSPDSLRKTRGRRGLDMLTKLQRESDIPVQISDMDFGDIREVDTKLVELAKLLRCPIVSNDVNLNRVATLQGVRVLNINELANAIKPIVLPGEEMRIRIVQEGKEHGQGVGFLDDGTMVVVEGGQRFQNSEIIVVINRVLQTGAGRMIFAQPR